MVILLKQILHDRNITYRQAEIMTGISKTTLQAIANEKQTPRLETLELIAAGLNIKITDIFDSPYK